ncbi:hypothetical protein ACSVHC_23670 [Arthrobacter sp. KNU-44]|uniref:hypothetical protein n=1 Tax=unclassified Arthrobacter TaxID=235627 RepID=UPI003F43A334
MSTIQAEAAAKKDAAKQLTNAGFVHVPNDQRNTYINHDYYVDFRVAADMVSYEVGPVSLLPASHPAKP